MKGRLFIVILFFCTGSYPCLSQTTQERQAARNTKDPSFISDSLDSYINQGLKDWDIPGLSIVIVKDGKIVTMKGYGVRQINSREAVDENTLFMIASNSKLFTGTALALLEYRNKLSLDDKLIKFLPDYRLYDSAATQQVTVRDILSHRIGTKTFQGDFTFWNSSLSRKEIMHRMRLLKPAGVFRKDFGYCNSCFLTAGELVPVVTGQPWEVFVYDSIILPLQMNNTHTMSAGYSERPNVALPYTTAYSGTLKRVPIDRWDNLGPAASMVSNVKDLSNWLFFQLDSGRFSNKQILPFEVLQKTRAVNISRQSGDYGLGVFMKQYQGRQIYWHTGGAAGMVSNVCFVPEEKLGIAILTNNDNQGFFEALRMQVLDAYLGAGFTNRSREELADFKDELRTQLKEIASWKARVKQEKPPLDIAAFTGEYANPLYGTISIRQNKQQLVIKFNTHADLTATLDYMDNGEWLMQYNNLVYGIFATRFTINGNTVTGISIKTNDYIEYDPYVFEKK